MNSRAFRVEGVLVAAMLALSLSTAFPAEPPAPSHPALTKEQREKMATIHEKMAACLRSDKSLADCHKEAMQSCQEMMGKEGCPMMGGMHQHMMQQPPKGDVHP
jgi:hypothetical protein